MFMLFNWGKESVDLGPALPYKCPHCEKIVALHLIHAQRKAGIFFLTLARFNTKYALVCPECQHGAPVSEEGVETAKALVLALQAVSEGKITEEEYADLVRQVDLVGMIKG